MNFLITNSFLSRDRQGVPMCLRPTQVDEDSRPHRNRAVTGRERLPHSYMFFRGAVAFGHARAPRVGRSFEEPVGKTAGYSRSLPVTARLRPAFFITLAGPQARGHSFDVVGQAIAFCGLSSSGLSSSGLLGWACGPRNFMKMCHITSAAFRAVTGRERLSRRCG